MNNRIRNADWETDEDLQSDIQQYVLQNLSRKELLDFVQRDYPQYTWSLRTLSRRMAHFNIKYIEYNVDLEAVETSVREETEGPGQLLGYKGLCLKLAHRTCSVAS